MWWFCFVWTLFNEGASAISVNKEGNDSLCEGITGIAWRSFFDITFNPVWTMMVTLSRWWTWLSGAVPFPVGQCPSADGDLILQHCNPRSAKYAVFLHDLGQCLKLCFKNPSVEFDFLVMFLICGLNLRSSERVTPRYGFSSTCLRFDCRVGRSDVISGLWSYHSTCWR